MDSTKRWKKACGVAVISAIAHADSPYEAAQEFKHLVDGIK